MQLNSVVDSPATHVDLPKVTIFGKLCALLSIKAVSFDYECRGIEMEAGRPGWDDALNGLPGLFGSSVSQSAEIARLASWLLTNLSEMPDTKLPLIVADFIDEVIGDMDNLEYCWDRAATIREKYREKVYHNSTTQTRLVAGQKLKTLLEGIVKRAKGAVEKCIDRSTDLMHTYYKSKPVLRANTSGKYRKALSAQVNILEEIEKFTQNPLPLFLEGQVHLLRISDLDRVRTIYKAVQKSPLFDTKLQMYKLNESLDSCPAEIGRARTFSKGWFENESIWTHMSYKYLLELLRAGAHEEFFKDARTMLVPFMDPGQYGRSILENSSFIASSACPDAGARGRGYVARLSGATAEFIHMWLIMTVGTKPFSVENGKLSFKLSPVLPGKWFTEDDTCINWNDQPLTVPKNSFACTLLGKTLLIYHNESRQDTFGSNAVVPVRYLLDKQTEITDRHLGPEIAEKIRLRQYKRIDVWLE